MKNIKVNIFTIVFGLLIYGAWSSSSQEGIPTAGGTLTGERGTVSFTVGQVVFTVLSGPEHSVIQGVQQPYEISVATLSDEISLTGIDVQVYPNPATHLLMIQIESPGNQNIHSFVYELSDMNGRVLEKHNLTSKNTSIGLSHLAPATYLLKVYQTTDARISPKINTVQSKTFKIIKNRSL